MLDCPQCGTTFEGSWHDESMDPEQRDEAPVAGQCCPDCWHHFEAEYPGWSYTSEAG